MEVLMILILGGAYQGKLDYALRSYNVDACDVWTCTDGAEGLDTSKRVIDRLEELVLAMIRHDVDPVSYVRERMDQLREKIVICRDVSSGVVPLDPIMRKWRDDMGRISVMLSRESDEVIRVFCGIGTKIK
jgi:adenosylcobinamide kinase / adenosylcobinamide-phosphate guanylyltransferase